MSYFTKHDIIEAKDSFVNFKGGKFRENQLETIEFAANSEKSIVILECPTGFGKCVKQGTRILTTVGLSKIENVYDKSNSVKSFKLEDCNIICEDKKTVGSYTSQEKVVTIKTNCGYSISGTHTHKIVVLQNGKLVWKRLNEIEHNTIVPLFVNNKDNISNATESISLNDYPENENKHTKHFKIDNTDINFGYFIGRLISDGALTTNGRISITSMDDNDFEFIKKLSEQIGFKYYISKKENNKACSINIMSCDLHYKLEQLGIYGYSKDKKIPDWIFKSSKEFMLSFLSGLFDGDSYYGKSFIEYYTSSKQLAYDLHELLLYIGVVSILKEKRIMYKGEENVSYRVYIIQDFLNNFNLPLKNRNKIEAYGKLVEKKHNTNLNVVYNIGKLLKKEIEKIKSTRSDKKKYESYMYGTRNISINKLQEFCKYTQTNNKLLKYFSEGNLFFDKITNIEYEEESVNVYDMEVEENHNYVANGFISHNSLCGTVLCKLFNDSIYLVHSKSLQEQIAESFPEFRILKGRSNYPCLYDSSKNCAECEFINPGGCKNKKRGVDECDECKKSSMIYCRNYIANCPYYERCVYRKEKNKVLVHPLRVLNYSYFLYSTNYAKQFNDKRVVVCDEADALENELLSMVQVSFTDYHLRKFKMKLPTYKTTSSKYSVDSWKKWAEEFYYKVRNKYEIEKESNGFTPKDNEYYTGFMNKLTMFNDMVDSTWIYDVVERTNNIYIFKPTWLTPQMTKNILTQHGNKFILMSATFPSVRAAGKSLGIPLNSLDYKEVPSSFDVNRRPIMIEGIASLNSRNTEEEFPKFKKRILEILDKHKGSKGLIHTSNYKIAKLVEKISSRIISHETANRNEVLEKFKSSDKPLVLVSPSMERGVSLNDELARFIIIVKCPFPDLGDKQISSRLYGSREGKDWYDSITAQTIEQMCGRGNRHAEDYCEIYILDGYVNKLIKSNPLLFSEYFRDCIVRDLKQ